MEHPKFIVSIELVYGPRCKKTYATYLQGLLNNKGADQPAHPRSLISAFVIRLLKVSYQDLLQAKFQFFLFSS